MKRKVLVIGGGAAGLMAAGTAASVGGDATIFEKNPSIGKKLLITGKGRCNFTNSADLEEIIKNIPGNGNFLYSALYSFTNTDLINFFNELGVESKIERGGRVFPCSDKASDIVEALKKYCRVEGVKIKPGTKIKAVETENGRVSGVLTENDEFIPGDSVIIATGGASYPSTGSEGDGYLMAERLGHTISPILPSLVPLIAREDWIFKLEGLSLKNVTASVSVNGKKKASEFGEMLFTRDGVSGPIILTLSRMAVLILTKSPDAQVTLTIDLKPALSEEQLDARIKRDFEENIRRQFKNSLDGLLPQKLIPVIIELSGIPPDKTINQITREERLSLVRLLKNFKITMSGARPIREAIITMGGVNVKEVNPSSMESKLIPGLFFAGEVLDLDAVTGGYNLQIAFSTGRLAGINSVRR